MIEYVTRVLMQKFNIKIDMAIYFYYELEKRRKLEHFINHIGEFKTFDELRLFYLGGK
jgi:hypothetical protein